MSLPYSRILTKSIASLVVGLALHTPAQAVDGTWTNLTGGTYSTTTNWLNGIVADGIDATADFSTLNITTSPTVTLDAARTLGTLRFGDATTLSNDWIFSGTVPLTLDVTTGLANIQVINRTATINTVLQGADGILAGNGTGVGGTLILTAANSFTGGLTVAGTILQLNNNLAAGSNVITIGQATTAAPTRLVLNGGVTVANTINIGAHTGAVGVGSLQQTGTGQATFSGAINITGAPSAGGLFGGGTAVGSELVLSGPITATAQLTHRTGRVIYSGGGTGYNALGVTGTALVGSTNGISTAAVVSLGVSEAATLDLNGFDQEVAGLNLGNTGAIFAGIVNLGARTLTLNGNLNTITGTTFSATHVISGTAGSTLNLGATARTLTVSDSASLDDLVIANTTVAGTGLIKAGAGTLSLSGVNSLANVTVNAGMLAAGRFNQPGTFTVPGLTFGPGATALRVKLGTVSDQINGGTVLTSGGTTTLNVLQTGGLLANGQYNLLNYTGTSPGLTGFALGPVGHATTALSDSGSALVLTVTGNDRVVWTGATSTLWNTSTAANWQLENGQTATNYIEGDEVVFRDLQPANTVSIATAVNPSRVNLTNTTASAYTFTGASGIAGGTGVFKSGNGVVTFTNPNTYLGATSITGGTLAGLYTAAIAPIPAASVITVASPGVFAATSANVDFTLNNTISGNGTVLLDANTSGTAGSRTLNIGGTLANFTGTLSITPTAAGGTERLTVDNVNDLGGATVRVNDRGQVFVSVAGLTIPNAMTLTGTGFAETSPGGSFGALRSNTTTFTGPITIDGAAKIGAPATVATFTNTISGGALTFGGAGTAANAETMIITNTATLQSLQVNDGLATAGVNTILVNVGNGGATGTLGATPVALTADGFKSAVIRFDRANGYTLGGNITSTSAVGANQTRNFVDLDTLGTGFADGGKIIALGAAAPAAGGTVRVAQTRAGAIATLTGTTTAERVFVSSALAGGTLNIASGATVTANTLSIGEAANASGVVNQNGGTVSIVGQLRVGTMATLTGTYNLSGGSLVMTGDSPLNTPSQAVAGGAAVLGDLNLNNLATAATVGGGIYLGLDGTGILNHTGGTISTNFLVLDTRTDTGAGNNMGDGTDRYNLSGAGSVLSLKSNYGIIQRNPTALMTVAGGTIRVDNTGTGTGTGANLTIPLDAAITATSGTTNLDTNGAGNAFTLTRDVRGRGTLNVVGGGTINLNTAGTQVITANLTGTAALNKTLAGTTSITGSGTGYTGNINVGAGRLNLPSNMSPAAVTVADGAALNSELATTALTLGASTGATLFFNPATAGALAAGNLTSNGTTSLDFSGSTAGPANGTFTALSYSAKTGPAVFALANTAGYRTAPVVTDTGSSVTVAISGTQALTWSGQTNGNWDQSTTANFINPAAVADLFYTSDTVTFDDTSTMAAVAVASGVRPWNTNVTSSTTNYVLTSAGSGIAGPGGLNKSGTSTLTFNGTNSYTGPTTVTGGTVAFSGSASLGDAAQPTNNIALNGGRLSYTGSGAVDLGANRTIAVGPAGGALLHNNAAAATITVPGNLTGAAGSTMTFRTEGVGVGTFILTGDNSGFVGNLVAETASTGTGTVGTLRINNQAAVPGGGSITVAFPSNASASGVINSLDLNDVTLPSALTLNFTSTAVNARSVRSQLLFSGNTNVNGNVTFAGSFFGGVVTTQNPVIQFSGALGSTLNINGNISEATPGGFSTGSTTVPTVFFSRGTGSQNFNGTINLPTSLFSRVDDTGITTINSTGNVWAATDVRSSSTLRIGANNALPVAALMTVGQSSDAGNSIFELNGFNQEVNGLTSVAGTANNARRVSNVSATLSTLTLNGTVDRVYGNSTGFTGGNLTGNLALVKNGSYTQTIAGPANTYTGNVTVNAGTLVAGGVAASNSLGSPTTAGRTITANNAGSTISLTTNNVFGSGVNNANLPSVVLNSGTTMLSNRYNVLGNVTLANATLQQSSTDTGNFEGYAFRGSVTVNGTVPSTISSPNSAANHLGANTAFVVNDATGSPATDLVISAPLRNQSSDFALAAGGFTKTGAGTLELSGVSSYSGPTAINGGTLLMTGSNFFSTVTINSGGTITGTGTAGSLVVASGGIASPGTVETPIGTLNSLALNLSTGGIVRLQLGATEGDAMHVEGALSLDGLVTLDLVLMSKPTLNTLFPIFNTVGGIGGYEGGGRLVYNGRVLNQGDFFTATTGSISQNFTIAYDAADGFNIVLQAVPEPSVALSLLSSASLLLGLGRFRRRA